MPTTTTMTTATTTIALRAKTNNSNVDSNVNFNASSAHFGDAVDVAAAVKYQSKTDAAERCPATRSEIYEGS